MPPKPRLLPIFLSLLKCRYIHISDRPSYKPAQNKAMHSKPNAIALLHCMGRLPLPSTRAVPGTTKRTLGWLHRAVPGLLGALPLRKLRNFGGKLGTELEAMGCKTAGDVAAIPRKALEARFGLDRGGFIYGAVRGVSDEPVKVGLSTCVVTPIQDALYLISIASPMRVYG